MFGKQRKEMLWIDLIFDCFMSFWLLVRFVSMLYIFRLQNVLKSITIIRFVVGLDGFFFGCEILLSLLNIHYIQLGFGHSMQYDLFQKTKKKKCFQFIK